MILLTRSESENQLATAELNKLGCSYCCAPMLSYANIPYNFSNTLPHIIITSKYAAKIAANKIATYTEAWVVGEESAAIIQSNDNIRVTAIAKDVQDLLRIIYIIPQEEAQEFFKNSIYLSGNIITHELPQYIKRDIIYEVVYAQTLPKEAIESIKNSEISYIMVYSKNSAINLIKLFELYNLLPYLKHSVVIGISKEVALLFESISSRVLHSELPGFSEMIKILAHEKNNTK